MIFGASLVATATLFWPQALAGNKFLSGFVTYEIMSFLIVILTITFASVANIHLSISRTQTAIKDTTTRERIEESFAKPLRAETRSSAWLLFWALAICTVALLVKGQFQENQYVLSAVHGVAVLVLITNAVVLHDIYATVFALVGLDDGKAKSDHP
ncbi:MAG: hypothetical protein V4574_18940 [Pseudomonadota bacterium]